MTDEAKFLNHLQKAVDYVVAGNLDAALEQSTEGIAEAPDRAEGYCILGIVAMQMEDAGRAIELLERAHKMAPDCQDYADILAVICAKVGKLADCIYYAKLSLTLEPHPELRQIIPGVFRDCQLALETASPSPHFVNANISFNMREYEAAAESCHKELRINNRDAASFVMLGRSLAALGKFEQAVDACHAAAHIDSSMPKLYDCMADSLISLGRFDEGAACWQAALSLAPDDYLLRARALASLAYAPEGKWRDAADEQERLHRLVCSNAEQIDPDDVPPDQEKEKIRIGFISDEFCESPASPYLEAAIDGLDKSRFEVYAYQQNIYQDATTTRFKSSSNKWLRISDLDDDTAANIIARDSVDILVDACGAAQGRSLPLFARRAAPIQVSWLGWPRGEGMETIDFRLTDQASVTVEGAFADTALRIQLDSGLVAFNAESMSLDFGKLRESPYVEANVITFGATCDLARITPSVARVWSQVLRATPGGRLLLGYVDFISLGVKTRVQELFSHFGVLDRVAFQLTPRDVAANHAFFSQIDIMLDPFPVSATAAACEALLAGIPVVTLETPRRTAISGVNILVAAGRAEWIAKSENELVRVASGLAMDTAKLSEMRTSLPKDLAKSTLCDLGAFAAALEAAFLQMLKDSVAD